MKQITLLALGLGLGLVVAGCSGWSDQRAQDRCNAEQAARADMFDAESMNECLSCFESCGDDCTLQSGSPARYLCEDN